MIERIRWNEKRQRNNPFSGHGEDLPLRITFHGSTLSALQGEEKEALDALRELAHLPQIEAVDSDAGPFRHFEIGDYEPLEEAIPLTVVDEVGQKIVFTGIYHPRQWPRIAAELANQVEEHPDSQIMLEHILVAQAHRTLGHDILVTASPWLLNSREKHWSVADANPHSPTEAAKIIGLFLRSRSIFTISASKKITVSMNRGFFYWILARRRLPSMWRYFGACVYAGLERQKSNLEDDTLELGQSILSRAVRAIQARDAIGKQFYSAQDNDVIDEILYHFDYLTLLLLGIFDAQALVAYRAYGLKNPTKEKDVGISKAKFLKELGEHPQGKELHKIITESFEVFRPLLTELRHTIHGTGLEGFSVGSISRIDETYLSVPPNRRTKLLDAASRYPSSEEWGIRQSHRRVAIEPYTYATKLIDESFKLIDEIASATDVEGLFPAGCTPPTLNSEPPKDNEVWSEGNLKRVALLG